VISTLTKLCGRGFAVAVAVGERPKTIVRCRTGILPDEGIRNTFDCTVQGKDIRKDGENPDEVIECLRLGRWCSILNFTLECSRSTRMGTEPATSPLKFCTASVKEFVLSTTPLMTSLIVSSKRLRSESCLSSRVESNEKGEVMSGSRQEGEVKDVEPHFAFVRGICLIECYCISPPFKLLFTCQLAAHAEDQ